MNQSTTNVNEGLLIILKLDIKLKSWQDGDFSNH